MNWTMKKWGIISSFLLLFISCNIKAPLEEILMEGNTKVAPYVTLTGSNDTLLIRNYLPQIGKIDSITSGTVEIKPIVDKSDCVQLLAKKGNVTIHEIQIWKQGKKSSLIAINKIRLDSNIRRVELAMKSFLNNVIFITSNDQPSKVVVVWQNTVLPDIFVTNDAKGISIFIPKEAKAIHHSTLRLFTQNKNTTGILSINLIDGEPLAQNKISNN
ncbi:MAG: hypothetical protein ACOYOT_12875 [Bacteroidales bacterium]